MVSKSNNNLIIAISNPIMRYGIEQILRKVASLSIIAVYSTVQKISKVYKPDCLIFDSSNRKDLIFVNELIDKHKNMRTVLLSSRYRLAENYLFTLRTHKLDAFIYDSIEPKAFTKVVNQLCNQTKKHTYYFPLQISHLLFEKPEYPNIILSVREIEILHYLSNGDTVEEVALKTELTKEEINTYQIRLQSRCGTKNMIPIILYAYNLGYIPLPKNDVK